MSGPTGAGKTTSSIWPHSYIIDTELGTKHYGDLIRQAESAVLQTTDPDEIVAELRTLLSEPHPYRTLVLDPITGLYEAIQEQWLDQYAEYYRKKGDAEMAEMGDFGPVYWQKVKRTQKRIDGLLKRLDMNVIVTAHEKPEYAPGKTLKRIGVTFDAMRGTDYLFDVVLRLTETKAGKRVAETIKDRTHKFPPTFEYGYDTIRTLYGAEELDREAKTITLASPDQAEVAEKLAKLLGIAPTTIAKWWAKDSASGWGEMTQPHIEACIEKLRERIAKANGGKDARDD